MRIQICIYCRIIDRPIDVKFIEVPVERIVEKIIEVPIEKVVIKEVGTHTHF